MTFFTEASYAFPMKPEDEEFQRTFLTTFGLYIGVGMQIVVATILGAWLGRCLDEKLASAPFFLLVGLVLGCGAGFYSMYRILNFYKNWRKK